MDVPEITEGRFEIYQYGTVILGLEGFNTGVRSGMEQIENQFRLSTNICTCI